MVVLRRVSFHAISSAVVIFVLTHTCAVTRLKTGNTMALYGNIPLLLAHGKVGKPGAEKSMTAVSRFLCSFCVICVLYGVVKQWYLIDLCCLSCARLPDHTSTPYDHHLSLLLPQGVFWFNPSETFVDISDGGSAAAPYKQSRWLSESGECVLFFLLLFRFCYISAVEL